MMRKLFVVVATVSFRGQYLRASAAMIVLIISALQLAYSKSPVFHPAPSFLSRAPLQPRLTAERSTISSPFSVC